MSAPADLHLHAGDLTSKWGFSDGDLIGYWIWNNLDDPTPYTDIAEHPVLTTLVRDYLMPALAEYDIKLTELLTIHNPIRAETVNGIAVDWYGGEEPWPFADITVAVPKSDVIRHLNAALTEGIDP